MLTTRKNHRKMDTLLLLILFSGCLLSTSGEVIKNHSDDLQNIFNNFDILIKMKNTASSESNHESTTQSVCVMSVDELNEIENAFVRHEDRLPDSHDVSIQFSSNCTDELNKLKTEILKLKNDFKFLITEPTSSHRYRNLKTKYELKILQFKNLLESTRKIISGKRSEVVVKLQNEFQSQQNKIFEVLDKLESEQKRLNDANVQVTITHLEQGKLDEAVAAFSNVTDHEIQIERIIVSAYGNGDNFENLYRFVTLLPTPSRVNGYKTLYEQLKKNNQMMDHRIWILATEINQIPGKDSAFIDTVMDDVKTIARNKNFDGLYEFLNKHGFGGLEAMKYFAPIFVLTVYDEADNGIENFLAVIKNLKFIRHRLYLINELILLLKASNRMHGKDVSMIIFELIKLRTVKKAENKFWQTLVEQNLPAELRDLMYNNLCIQNAENDEYLYASGPASGNQRHVYTANTKLLNESFYWQVYFTNNGTKLLIKNNKHGEHLYLIDEGNHNDDHVLRSWMAGSLEGDKRAEFYLDMLGNGQFLIVNKYFGQVLYSPFDGEPNAANNRPVFSKKYDPNNIELDSKWIIGICRLDVEYVF